MNITQLRQKYQQSICENIIRINRRRGYPNFADGSSSPSVDHAWGIVRRLPYIENDVGISGQTAGRQFEIATEIFLREAFTLLQHIRPGVWEYSTQGDIAQFDQYEHLTYINIVAVTAEPWPARIAALALGTGDLDCVYHFALNELVDAAKELKNQDSLELLIMMVDGRRLRDISDLPFDLAL